MNTPNYQSSIVTQVHTVPCRSSVRGVEERTIMEEDLGPELLIAKNTKANTSSLTRQTKYVVNNTTRKETSL